MMIDDDDIGCRGALAHAGHETLIMAGTFAAEARFGGCRDLVPERQVFGQILDLSAIAGFGPSRPLLDDSEKHAIFYQSPRAATCCGTFVQLIETVQAQ